MALELRHQLKMVQRQVITPQLQQAIKLLQLNHLDLGANVQEQMLENPALEEIPDSRDPVSDSAETKLKEEVLTAKSDEAERKNGAETNDTDWQKVLEGYSASAFKTGSGGGTRFDDLPPIETNLASSNTLVDHLIYVGRDSKSSTSFKKKQIL